MLLLVEPAHHALRRVEAEGAAARQADGVDDLDDVDRVEQVGLARAGRAAAHVDAAGGRRPATRIAVQPVGRSVRVKCPTLMPWTSVRPLPRRSAPPPPGALRVRTRASTETCACVRSNGPASSATADSCLPQERFVSSCLVRSSFARFQLPASSFRHQLPSLPVCPKVARSPEPTEP